MKKNRIKIIVFLVLAFVGAEVVLRLAGGSPGDTTWDVEDGRRIVRSSGGMTGVDPDTGLGHPVRWDKAGLRVHGRFTFDPDPARRNILLVGDGHVEGLSCLGEGSLAVTMQRLLEAADPDGRWQVLNAGLTGSGPVEQFFFLRELLFVVRPESVIQFHSPDDLDDLMASTHSSYQEGRLTFNEAVTPVGALWKNLRIAKAFGGPADSRSANPVADAVHRDDIGPDQQQALGHFAALMNLQNRFLLDQNVELVLCEVPVPSDWTDANRKNGLYSSRIGEICDGFKVPYKRLKMVFDAGLGWPASPEEFGKVRSKMFFTKSEDWNTLANLGVGIELVCTMLRRDIREIPEVQKLLAGLVTGS